MQGLSKIDLGKAKEIDHKENVGDRYQKEEDLDTARNKSDDAEHYSTGEIFFTMVKDKAVGDDDPV